LTNRFYGTFGIGAVLAGAGAAAWMVRNLD
jgi:hypothetical protein